MAEIPQEPEEALALEQMTRTLFDVAQQLSRDLHPHRQIETPLALYTSLERDLGLDSLGRMELLLRLEKTLHLHLGEQAVISAEVLGDILQALRQARGTPHTVSMPEVYTVAPQALQEAPGDATTLLEVLFWHCQRHPERPHILLYDEDEQVVPITYGELARQASSVAAGLQARGIQPGQTVALMLPTGSDFFSGFYGILLAGGIPVPIYPPARLSQIEDHLRRQVGILQNAQSVALLTVPQAQPLARLVRAHVDSLQAILTVPELATMTESGALPAFHTDDLALLQYTSGSTGAPKGVMLTHAHLLANLRAMGQAVGITATDVFVSWLPLYHDMGLIGAWMGSLYYACPLVLMSPLAFLARPIRWLQAIHQHRGTLSAGPNFAYELCVQKLTDADIAALDLRSWRCAFNGAEPVSASTIRRFCKRFAACGFRAEAMLPVYGLAEAALGIAFPQQRNGLQIDRVQREPLARSGHALPAAAEDTAALEFVTCGEPLPGYAIRLVDSAGFEVGERQEGRLEFQGPSATPGYFRNPAATQQLRHGPWVDSGDMAYSAEGQIYLTGRAKDIIIRAGRNIYPHEVEAALNTVPGIRQGCVAVFGSADPHNGTERLIILAETRETDPAILQRLRSQVEAIATDLLGTPPDDVVLAPPQSVLKTSSGKIRRAASRERYEAGDLGQRPRAVWRQMARLALAGASPQWRRLQNSSAALGYAGYFWICAGVGLLTAWLGILTLPRLSWRQKFARGIARTLLRCLRTPLLVRGQEHFPSHGAYVVVANHASYLDGFLLTAILPAQARYVVKRELAGQFFARLLLQRLGAAFVERFEAQQGIEDTAQVLQVVQQGHPITFFPEGTFRRTPGLLPFRMGAFLVAAQAGVPIIPLSLRGTRSMLRGDQWFPRRGTLQAVVGEPIQPVGNHWEAAIALRDAARQHIARFCGEPEVSQE